MLDFSERSTWAELLENGLNSHRWEFGVQLNILTCFKYVPKRPCFRQILLRTGLTNSFDVTVGVDTCRKAKPDKTIFLYAVNKLGIQPKEAVFVGDSIERDYNGAKKAGLRALLIDRAGKAPANVEKIRSLTDVLAYISRVQG